MVIILFLGDNPLAAYASCSSPAAPRRASGPVAQLIPLAVLSSAVIISFRAGFFNIGGEGQLYVGAFTGAWVGSPSLPAGPLLVLLYVPGRLPPAACGG